MNDKPQITLVMPNLKWSNNNYNDWTIIPYNLCLLAAILEPGYNVDIVDANIDNLSHDQFEKIIREKKPNIVGITALSDECGPSAHFAAKIVKSISKDIVTILGGIYATINADIIIEDKNIDYIVIGEAEFIIIELVRGIINRTTLPRKGLAFKKNNQPVIQGHAELIENLDDLPFPAYHKIDFGKYSNTEVRHSAYKPHLTPYGRIITSRGCNIGCIFCQNEYITGKGYRCRSVDNVLREIEWLIKEYKIKSLLIDDANFTANMKRAKAILQGMIDKNFNLKWKAMNLAVFYLDEELLELMKQSGADYIDLAIESGVKRVLKEIIHKPVNLRKTMEIIKKAKKMGFSISANFIIGFPGETWKEIRKTIKFAEEIDVDYVKLMIAMPLRHTILFNIARETCSLSGDFNFTDLRWGEGKIKTTEFDPIELNFLRLYEWDRINFGSNQKQKRVAKLMGISIEEVENLRTLSRSRFIENIYISKKTL